MHELPVTESILKVILKHAEKNHANKVVRIHLRIGEMSDIADEWLQRYFEYISKGTLAEGASIKVERSPVIFRCDTCGETFQVKIREVKQVVCPKCGGDKAEFVSGREYYIKEIEVI
jgi:hydrogenase nickel incorporation protein HypA/HybF